MNRPSIVELECFVAVAEESNFSRAARRLNLTQPPLSRHIRSLEEKLGSRLFDRNTRSVALTPAGTMFLRDAAALLLALDSAAEAVRRAGLGETSRLRIAFVGALLEESFVRVIQEFRNAHPLCQLHLSDLPPRGQMERIEDGSVDIAFVGACPRRLPRKLRSLIWKREPLLVALPEDHRMASSDTIRLKELSGAPWVMVSRQAAPEFRLQFDGLCQAHGFKPRVVEETDRVPAVLTMVAAGQGCSLLPSGVSHLLPIGIRFLPISSRRRPMLEHACLYRERPNLKEISDFLSTLRRLS
jgi:DNA-binding transcriptional LysR family regulator